MRRINPELTFFPNCFKILEAITPEESSPLVSLKFVLSNLNYKNKISYFKKTKNFLTKI